MSDFVLLQAGPVIVAACMVVVAIPAALVVLVTLETIWECWRPAARARYRVEVVRIPDERQASRHRRHD